MTLCKSLHSVDGNIYPMANIFFAEAFMNKQRQALSYVEAVANSFNPFPIQPLIRSHEFHYSHIELISKASFAYDVLRGSGIVKGKDGIIIRNTLGTYMHQHALSNREWGQNIVDKTLSI